MDDKTRTGRQSPVVVEEESPGHRVLRVRPDLQVRKVIQGRRDQPALPELKVIQVLKGR